MKGSTTLLLLVACGAAGLWLSSYTPERGVNTAAAPVPSALITERGQRIDLRQAGVVIWNGAGMNNGAMTIHCAKNGVVYGFYAGSPVALNGHSMTLGRGGNIQLANGEKRRIVSTDRSDLVSIGAISGDADPLIYNRKADEGLKIGTTSCA